MMNKPISNACLVDIARLRVADFEVLVAAMLVGTGHEVAMEREYVRHQIPLKLLHIGAFALASPKLSPRFEHVLDGDDILVCMSELPPRSNPHQRVLPVIERAKAAYKLWLIIHRKMARSERFGIGDRIDVLWLDLLDALRKASYASLNEKLISLDEAIRRVDAVRFFLQIAWESGLMAQSHFIALGKDIEEIGRMVGGWKKGILAKTPPKT